MIVLEPSTYIF